MQPKIAFLLEQAEQVLWLTGRRRSVAVCLSSPRSVLVPALLAAAFAGMPCFSSAYRTIEALRRSINLLGKRRPVVFDRGFVQ